MSTRYVGHARGATLKGSCHDPLVDAGPSRRYRITFICVAVMPYCAGLKFGSLVRM